LSDERDRARERWFREQHDATRRHYLAEPGNPYRGSGRSSGAARWEETRRFLADAVDRDGDFMDVGCANGLLLETLTDWCRARGHEITPHGIDFVAELVELARARHAAHRDSFEHANAFAWQPRRRYDFVRVSLEIVPAADRPELVRRMFTRALAPRGRLIVCHYPDRGETLFDVAAFLEGEGYRVVGRAGMETVDVAWTDRGPE
jgi:2-polyprenyl-3-methyl-5-hydroxy-6-metoxy-1,4-benzoquinol methylase